MKVFSQSPKGYLEVWKWSFVALFVVGLLRFFMAPMGIPIETGGKVVSLTVVLLVALVGYTAYFGWSGGKLGDVIVTAFGLAIVYTAVLALFLSLRTVLMWSVRLWGVPPLASYVRAGCRNMYAVRGRSTPHK